MKNIKLSALLFCLILFSSAYAQRYDFDDQVQLKDWKRFYQAEGWPDMMQSIAIKDGMLYLEPYTSGWYADYHAPFLFREVTGDFTVHTRLLISGRKTKMPQTTWSLAGIMVRAPRNITAEQWTARGEDWLFLTTGLADRLDQPVFETKTTVKSKSRLKLYPNRLEWVELKVARKGAIFTLWYKYDREDWQKIETFERPDLPATLQVGLNAYTDFYSADKALMQDVYRYNQTVVTYGKPDLKVSVDFININQ